MDTPVVQEDENATKDSAQENKECKEEVFNPTVFVNTRRGRGNGTKRKISDTATVTEYGASIPPSAAEVLHIITFPTPTEVQQNEQFCIVWHVFTLFFPTPYCYKYAKLVLGSLCMGYFAAV